jgi:hypothetical protein
MTRCSVAVDYYAEGDVPREHCEREGRDYDSIEKTVTTQVDPAADLGATLDQFRQLHDDRLRSGLAGRLDPNSSHRHASRHSHQRNAVVDQGEETAIHAPDDTGPKSTWSVPPRMPNRTPLRRSQKDQRLAPLTVRVQRRR